MRFVNNFFLYRRLAYHVQKCMVERNPMSEINRNYKLRFQKLPDLDNPRNLIEKIYWMQLHCDTSLWTMCADKYRMREYVKQRGCEEYLPKIYGVWNTPDEINWNELPKQFVIKANNGCGSVLVVRDKSKYNFKKVKKQLKQWLAIPYGYRAFQPHYLGIKPCILAEELLVQNEELNNFSPDSIVDFKFWCFNGNVESILVVYNRTDNYLNRDLYDSNWTRLLECIKDRSVDKVHSEVEFPRPVCFEQMKDIASKLSKGFPQMRVDFYLVNDQPVIGELTLTTGYGTFTEEYYNHLGDLTDTTLMKVIR